jgi:hypothetical protein
MSESDTSELLRILFQWLSKSLKVYILDFQFIVRLFNSQQQVIKYLQLYNIRG